MEIRLIVTMQLVETKRLVVRFEFSQNGQASQGFSERNAVTR